MTGTLSLPAIDVDIYLDESYLIEEDFEQWNDNSWTVQLNEAGRFYISGGAAYRGAFGMACVTAWSVDTDREQAMIYKSFTNASDAVVYLNFRLRFTESISNGYVALVEFTEGASLTASFELVDTSGVLNFRLRGDVNEVLLTDKALSTGVWYQVKIGFKEHSTVGVEYVEVDGVVLRDFTGDTGDDGDTVNRVYIGIDTWFSEQSCIGYYDNIRLKLADINVNYSIYDETILALSLHLGTTKEVSGFEIVVDRGNPSYDNTLDPGEANALSTGYEADIFLGRGSNKPLLLTGQIEEIEYVDEMEDYEFRNAVIIRGRCKGYQLFGRKYDGDLITAVGTTTRNYERTSGDASSLVAYLIDNYTSLTHFRGSGAMAANANISQKNVTVGTGEGATFAVGDLVKIGDDVAWEYNRVVSISTDTLTMAYNLLANYTTAAYGYVQLDLIKKTDTAYTKMEYIETTIYEIIKFIADSADTGGVIGYDFRVEYDGNFAFIHLSGVAEGYNLSDECQLHRYVKDANRIKNKITVKGKADKPYPVDADGQPYSDSWTELVTPSNIVALSSNAAASQATVEVAEGASDVYTVGDVLTLVDDSVASNTWFVGTIESIVKSGGSEDVITFTTDLDRAYNIADDAMIFEISPIDGWGFHPEYVPSDLTIISEASVVDTGSYSVEVTLQNNHTRIILVKALQAANYIDTNEYTELKFRMHFVTTAPSSIIVNLRNYGTENYALWSTNNISGADRWIEFTIPIGSAKASEWNTVSGSFDWSIVAYISVEALYGAASTHKLYMDRFQVTGRRWGDGSDHATIDGFAENTTSQTTYGIREYVHTSDLLLSDAECEFKALALLNYYDSERLIIEVDSDTIDWTTYHPTPGNTTGLDLDQLGVTGSSYRIDSIDILYRSEDNSLRAIYTLGKAPLKQADYLYELGKAITELRNEYGNIR